VTLRHDVHTAIDEIAPPAPALARQVVASLAPAGKSTQPTSRIRRNPRVTGLGRTGSLAAAILVVLLIATLVVGVRVWRDRNALNPSPAVPAIDQVELARLQARPLILPLVPPGGVCPNSYSTETYGGTPYTVVNSNTGLKEAPIYESGPGLQATTTWGDYYDATYSADQKLRGIVLIRLRDLKTGQAGVFVGSIAAGEVIGTDTIDGKTVEHHPYAVIDLSHPPATQGNTGVWTVRQGWPARWSGCYAFQLDSPDFTEVIAGSTGTST
jgi:hypothetical protein